MKRTLSNSRAQQASRERIVEYDDRNLGSRKPKIRKLQSSRRRMAMALSSSGFSLALKPME